MLAALPGIALLLVCRQTLEYTRLTESFMPRTRFSTGYRFALRLLLAGTFVMILWLVLLGLDALHLTDFPWLALLFEAGAVLALSGVVLGGVLDYRSLRQISSMDNAK